MITSLDHNEEDHHPSAKSIVFDLALPDHLSRGG